MTTRSALRALAVLLAVLTVSLPARAAEGDSVFERWQADPTQVFEAVEIDLAELKWQVRPVIVFADSPRDPSFIEQMDELLADTGRLIDRDVLLITDTDPAGRSDLREKLRPRGFSMVLIGMDGSVKLRKPQPWTVRELSRSIDKMPMRRRELREQG